MECGWERWLPPMRPPFHEAACEHYRKTLTKSVSQPGFKFSQLSLTCCRHWSERQKKAQWNVEGLLLWIPCSELCKTTSLKGRDSVLVLGHFFPRTYLLPFFSFSGGTLTFKASLCCHSLESPGGVSPSEVIIQEVWEHSHWENLYFSKTEDDSETVQFVGSLWLMCL